jgi:hypothetical protein
VKTDRYIGDIFLQLVILGDDTPYCLGCRLHRARSYPSLPLVSVELRSQDRPKSAKHPVRDPLGETYIDFDSSADTSPPAWTRAATNWHRMRVQMPHFKGGGLGLTPQCASGLAAFYSASSTFVGWLAQRPHMLHWIRQGQNLHDHST